ncbi:MAG TPA: alpha-amylase family glycosyl hydrolase [Myxococcaceae bacterium]|nr:alpha-amylase family glycosyl hydrolase [Myxococcaceae bacterium]
MPATRRVPMPALMALVAALGCTASRPQASTTPGSPSRTDASWANGAVFYEVFVRSFQDSNGDGRGDLPGLVSRLDYLNDGKPETDQDLGVDALWLMPVFASPSYHGYDTTDYERVNPDYGTNEDLRRLCDEAHRRGMRVIVDLVLNHTSREHPWFIESASGPTSPKRDWYVWSPTELHWSQPWNAAGSTWHMKNGAWYYGLFWAGMPDLNFRTPAVRAEAKRLAALWLSRGLDGFRLDAIRHLVEDGPDAGQSDTPETHAFLKEFAAHVRSVRPDAMLVGEAWTETPAIAAYYGDLPLNFDFPLASKIVEGVQVGESKSIAAKLREIAEAYPPGANDVPFLTNHDMRRVATVLKGDAGKLRSAAAILLTLPGTPFLYYGEEIGLLNGTADGDEAKRTPMPWNGSAGAGFTPGTPWYRFAPGQETTHVAAQTSDPRSLLSHYRRWIRARHASPALSRGTLRLVQAEGPVLTFVRSHGWERVLVAHNLGAEPRTLVLEVEGARAEPLLAADGVSATREAGAVRLVLPPFASAAFRL